MPVSKPAKEVMSRPRTRGKKIGAPPEGSEAADVFKYVQKDAQDNIRIWKNAIEK